MRVFVRTRLYPTEVVEKVVGAVEALFPGIEVKVENGEVIGESSDASVLDRFRDVIRSRRVRDTFEEILLRNWSAGVTWFDLNKQDATRGMFNIAENGPLGEIHVEIEIPKDKIHEMVWGSYGDRSEVQG